MVTIVTFIFFTSPTSTHALIHTAHANGLEPVLDETSDASDKKEDGSS